MKPRFSGSHSLRDVSDSAQVSSAMEYSDCRGMHSRAFSNAQIGAGDLDRLDDVDLHTSSSEDSSVSSHSYSGSSCGADPRVTSKSGFDFEIRLEESEDDGGINVGMGRWVVKICKAAVREPVSNKDPCRFVIYLFICYLLFLPSLLS